MPADAAEGVIAAVTVLRTDPQMRVRFINMIAAPIANELFESGLIPVGLRQ